MTARSKPAASPGEAAPTVADLHCRDCPMWYGAEDGGWGPCSIKNRRGEDRYLTWGGHACDEGYEPPAASRLRAAPLSGSRSTSRASAVGYSSTSNAGHGRRSATRRRSSDESSTRRRSGSKR